MKLCFDGVPVVKGSNSGGGGGASVDGGCDAGGPPAEATLTATGPPAGTAADNTDARRDRPGSAAARPARSSPGPPKSSPSASLKSSGSSSSSSSSSTSSSLSSPSSSSSSSSSPASSSSTSSNVTAFLSKLWRMVNDNHNDDQIRWSQSGCSFVIINQIQFAKDMLPLYFKHSNMASFIRQLNMYGFRKIPVMGANGSADQRADLAQFYHMNFMRGQEQRLSSIKRKNNSSKTHNLVVNGSFCDEVRAILNDVKSIRDGQSSSESILGAIQLDNKSLWRDVAILRNQHHKQRRVIEKLIQFLLSLIQNRGGMVKKRRVKSIISADELIGGGFLFNMTASEADEGLLQMGAGADEHCQSAGAGAPSPSFALKKETGELGQQAGSLDCFGASAACSDPAASGTSRGQMVGVYHSQRESQGQLQSEQAASGASASGSADTQLNGSANTSSLVTLCQSAAMVASTSAGCVQMSGLAEDELVPGGGTAASTTAAPVAAAAAASLADTTSLGGPTHTPSPVSVAPNAGPSRNLYFLAATSDCTTPTPPSSTVANGSGQVTSRLLQLGQENININAGQSPVPIASHQHHNHLQIQQQQQQQQHHQHPQHLQHPNQHQQQPQQHSQPLHHQHQHHLHPHPHQHQHQSQPGYSMVSRQFQSAGSGYLFGHQQVAGLSEGAGAPLQSPSSQLSQQPAAAAAQQFARSAGGGAGQSINGLLSGQTIVSRLGNCQRVSQWAANSVYNTMAQPDLGGPLGGGAGASGGLASGGPGSFSNMISELRAGPRFLSALEQQTGAGGVGNFLLDGASGSPAAGNILGNSMSAGGSSMNSRLGSSGHTYY